MNATSTAAIDRGARHSRTRRLAASTLVALLAVSASAVSPALAAPSPSASTTASGAYLVRFEPGTDVAAEAANVASLGGQVTNLYTSVFPGLAANLPSAAYDALARNRNVTSLERDGIATIEGKVSGTVDLPIIDGRTTTPTTGLPAYSWGQDRVDQRALPLSTTFTPPNTGAGVRAYVVDTGIVASHTEFGGRVVDGMTAIADGNGTTDCNWHGTHVAGTIGGDIYGLADRVTLVPVRVLDCSGSGTWSGVIAGLDWIKANHPAGVPGVVNMSLGGGANDTVDTAVRGLVAAGFTVSVAAGNDGGDACLQSPARELSAITVASADDRDQRSAFTNTGACIDVFAPGEGIAAASYTGGASIGTGTSMSAAHATGAAAVIAAMRPTAPLGWVARSIAAVKTPDAILGVSSDTVDAALFMPQVAPPDTGSVPSPTGLTASISGSTVKAAWQNGGTASTVSGYLVWVFQVTTAGPVLVSLTDVGVNLKATVTVPTTGQYVLAVGAYGPAGHSAKVTSQTLTASSTTTSTKKK